MRKQLLFITLITTALAPSLHAGWLSWPFGGQAAPKAEEVLKDLCKTCGKVKKPEITQLPVVAPVLPPTLMQDIVTGLSHDWKAIAGIAATGAVAGGMYHWATNRGKGIRNAQWSTLRSGIAGGACALLYSVGKTMLNTPADVLKTAILENKENLVLLTTGAAFIGSGWYVNNMVMKDRAKKNFIRGLTKLAEGLADNNRTTTPLTVDTINNVLVPDFLKDHVGLVIAGNGQPKSLIGQFVDCYNNVHDNVDAANTNSVMAKIKIIEAYINSI